MPENTPSPLTRRVAWPAVIPVVVLAAWILGTAPGCHNPRFREAQAARNERIVRYAKWVEHREAGRPAHIQWVRGVARDLRVGRAEQLDRTTRALAERVRRDRRHWRETAEARAAWFRAWRDGTPQEIPDRFAAMAY